MSLFFEKQLEINKNFGKEVKRQLKTVLNQGGSLDFEPTSKRMKLINQYFDIDEAKSMLNNLINKREIKLVIMKNSEDFDEATAKIFLNFLLSKKNISKVNMIKEDYRSALNILRTILYEKQIKIVNMIDENQPIQSPLYSSNVLMPSLNIPNLPSSDLTSPSVSNTNTSTSFPVIPTGSSSASLPPTGSPSASLPPASSSSTGSPSASSSASNINAPNKSLNGSSSTSLPSVSSASSDSTSLNINPKPLVSSNKPEILKYQENFKLKWNIDINILDKFMYGIDE